MRQLWDGKSSADLDEIDEDALEALIEAPGMDARPRACTAGDRFAIAGYLGKGDGFDRALVRFAQSYADQNRRDYQAFLESLY
ncbi:MAG: DUF2252 family protein [Eggerthellaceae bacterium]